MKYFSPKLYIGNVYHKRFTPKVHEFVYRSFFIKISIVNIKSSRNLFFSINRFNLFSFYTKDHGHRDNSSLIEFANELLSKNNLDITFDDIVMHTYPRILGYVFNPVSFWYFYKDGEIVCKFAEVNNTFGETKTYIIIDDNSNYIKQMQVSPFNLIQGDYKFRFRTNGSNEKVEIIYSNQNEKIIYASIEGSEIEFNWKNLLFTFLKCPYYNIGALVLIHFEALRLYLKRIPFYGKNGVIND